MERLFSRKGGASKNKKGEDRKLKSPIKAFIKRERDWEGEVERTI